MRQTGYSNQSLATRLGKPTPSAVSNTLSREKGMRIDTFLTMLEAMGAELVVRYKDDEWMLTEPRVQDETTDVPILDPAAE